MKNSLSHPFFLSSFRFLSQRLFKILDNIMRIFETDRHTNTVAAPLVDNERADVSQADPWFA